MNKFILIICFCLINFSCNSQLFNVEKRINSRESKKKENFPPKLIEEYPDNSLGQKLQNVYMLQAKENCGIQRSDIRDYIPYEIKSGYNVNNLKETLVYEIPVSAQNIMFLTLNNNDKVKIENGNFIESEYLQANRIIGLNDNLINYGQSVLSPIPGFPSLIYQKSCGSYFEGDAGATLDAPLVELKTSLAAETKKNTSITTISGKFVSPLYLIFRRNSIQSTYSHLLLWSIYYDNYINTSSNSLYDQGKYITEFDATLVSRSNSTNQSLKMNGRLSAGISAGIFNTTGNINTGLGNKVSFSLADFRTFIHKRNRVLLYNTADLPKINDINVKLQNSLTFDAQPSLDGYVTNLLPTTITRNLYGIPQELCNVNSWFIDNQGYDLNIWENAPTVKSVSKPSGKDGFPECICSITGMVSDNAIQSATNGTIDLNVVLTNTKEINGLQLKVNVNEPTVKVTDAPKVVNINESLINASRSMLSNSNGIHYTYDLFFAIDETGVNLKTPHVIRNAQIEYVNPRQNLNITSNPGGLLLEETPRITGNSVSAKIRTQNYDSNFENINMINASFKLKFELQLANDSYTELATKTINLVIPVHSADIQNELGSLSDNTSTIITNTEGN